eukprot:gene34868-50378_t
MVGRACGRAAAPVMHSPPRKLTMKDMQDWKVPPCISNWKNPKGYTIPLDKRLAADGRGLQEVQINDGFAKLSESLVSKKIQLREKERREGELREMAIQAREEKQRQSTAEERDARRQRDEARDQRRRDWEH